MAEPMFEESYEYLSEDGQVSEECPTGAATFRPKGATTVRGLWMVPDKVPNAETLAAIKELEDGRGERFDGTDALFKDLGI